MSETNFVGKNDFPSMGHSNGHYILFLQSLDVRLQVSGLKKKLIKKIKKYTYWKYGL